MVIKLIFRILLFSSIIFLISYLALYLNPDYKKEYVAVVVPKLEKLKTTKGQKIVIIGGSNASFGIDTDLMERKLGVPVVNMSLHGGLPLKFIIEQARCYLNKGDVLILSKEYSGLKNQYWNKMSGIELPKIVTYDLSQLKILVTDKKLFESTVTGLYKTIKYYIAKHPIKEKKEKKSVYSLEAFEGDNLKTEFIEGKFKKALKVRSLHKSDSTSTFIKGLKSYKKHFENRGVEFYLTPPVIVKGYYKNDEVLPFWEALSKSTGISMLSNNKKYTYDKKYFFNSHYHTNVEGRRIRTLSLIEDISENKKIFKTRRKHQNISIANREYFNEAHLDLFTKMQNYKVLKREANAIQVKQSGDISKNYFRMCIENKNYENYNLYLNIECDTLVLKNIRFRGIGEKEEFDTIINLGNKKYEFWKKVNKVFYKDNNSYIGVTLLNKKKLVGKEFTINGVGLYKDFNNEDEIVKSYSLSIEEGEEQFLKIKSNHSKVNLSDIVSNIIKSKKIELKTGRLYRITKKDEITLLLDFYTKDIIFQTRDKIVFKSLSKNIIKIFK